MKLNKIDREIVIPTIDIQPSVWTFPSQDKPSQKNLNVTKPILSG